MHFDHLFLILRNMDYTVCDLGCDYCSQLRHFWAFILVSRKGSALRQQKDGYIKDSLKDKLIVSENMGLCFIFEFMMNNLKSICMSSLFIKNKINLHALYIQHTISSSYLPMYRYVFSRRQ